MARVKLMKEWFAVVGAMLIFTQDVLDDALNTLDGWAGEKDSERDAAEATGTAGRPN